MTAPRQAPLLAITVPTYRRPETLARLLDALPEQRAEAEGAHGVRTSVIVIDNDPQNSARAVVAAHDAAYTSAPLPGLAAVRNAALDSAASAHALVFIDDDEIPTDGWLSHLVGAWLRHGAEFVSGKVESVFDPPVDPWIDAGGFFRRVEFAEGAPMAAAPTNNLLIDLGFTRAHGLRFDEAFALTGGEDIRFTSAAVARGARIVACPAAVVLDPVPADRATRSWVLRRAYRVGVTTALNDLAGAPGVISRTARRARRMIMGIGGCGLGAARSGWGVASRSLVNRARGARLMARGAGMAAGALGIPYREYRARHTAEARDVEHP